MSGNAPKKHRFVDELELDIETQGLDHEISFSRLQEIIEGYSTLLSIVNDDKSYDINDVRTTANESADKKASHAIYLSPAREGSYAATARIYDDSEMKEPPLPLYGEGFTPVFQVIQAVSDNNVNEFEKLLPSKLSRTRALDAIRKICPRENESIQVVSHRDPKIDRDMPTAAIIDFDGLLPSDESFVDGVVVGTICSVNFEAHELKFRPSNSRRKYTVTYDPNMEDRLVLARKSLMVVNCGIRYDHNGDIAEIKDIGGIEELDLHDIELSEFNADGEHVEFRNPLHVHVSMDTESGQICIGENEDLGMVVYGEHMGDLLEEVRNDLAWRWTNIALAPDDELASDARRIKAAFLGMVVR